MASIERRGAGRSARYVARWRDPQGAQRAKTFGRKIDAQRFLERLGSSVQQGAYVDPSAGKMLFSAWAVKWEDTLGHLKPATRATYDSIQHKHVLPRWGAVPLARVTHEDVAAWVGTLTQSSLAPASVRYVHRVLALQLDLAVRSGRLARNPAEGVRLPRSKPVDKRFLTHEQVGALAVACDDYAPVIYVLGYCGLRWGELAGLRVGRVDPLRRRLEVVEAVSEVRGMLTWGSPKSHQQRSVPIPRFLVDELTPAMAGKQPSDLLFTSRRGGVLRNLNFRRDVFDLAALEAGLEGLTPHELRHTAASLAVSAGANVKAVQRMLGHASAAMTLDVYSGLFDDDLDGVAERLDAGRSVHPLCTDPEVIPLHRVGTTG